MSGVDKTMSFTKNNDTVGIHVIKLEQNVTYTCEAANKFHAFYSAYTYSVFGMVTKNNSLVYLHFYYLFEFTIPVGSCS